MSWRNTREGIYGDGQNTERLVLLRQGAGWVGEQALEGPSLSQCCLQIERREEPKWALFVDRWESVCQRLDEVIPYGQALAENEADPTR